MALASEPVEPTQARPRFVDVYGADHSPWLQAVLLGLFEAGIPHRLRSLPTMESFLSNGVFMPVASIDGGPWKMESADILQELGYSEVTLDEMHMVNAAWRGVWHRPDSAALFFGGFSLAGDRNPSRVKRLASNFLRHRTGNREADVRVFKLRSGFRLRRFLQHSQYRRSSRHHSFFSPLRMIQHRANGKIRWRAR